MKYLCFDTALNGTYTLVKLLQLYPHRLSLFSGTDDENIWDAAPWLFEIADNFYALRSDNLIQLDHCVVFDTNDNLEELCRFLQYYMYESASGTTRYVRVWDARVLLSRLRQWDPMERVRFFDTISCFYTEHADGLFFDKWEQGSRGGLVSVPVLKNEVLQNMKEGAFSGPEGVSTDPESFGVHPSAAAAPADEATTVRAKRRKFFID